MLTSIEVCYHIGKGTDEEAMDLLLSKHMQGFKADWVASDHRWSKRKRWVFWPYRERSNTYIIAREDLDNVKALLPGCFYVSREQPWPFLSV